MIGADLRGKGRIGIYVRESRDDNEENYETIETQKGLLISLAIANNLGPVVSIYADDNVSGSGFDREGLDRLKKDVLEDRIDLLLLKDLSRLGRNNARTLLFLDFLEENGVRIITSDGRYDSVRDNDTVGIETWFNERYVRDISQKIRASLKFKIEKGEYLGHAPYGYKKSEVERNRLVPDEGEAFIVRLVFSLYRSGLGYTSVAGILNERGYTSPGGVTWSQTAVRRILCGRVYTGDTVQGISERISFKSKKTRRKPEDRWVVTPDTHEPLITREEFEEVQKIREGKVQSHMPHKSEMHPLRGLVYCGRCGSIMYSRKRSGGRTAYVCSRYYRKGSRDCSSHFIYEDSILDLILEEISQIIKAEGTSYKFDALEESSALFKNDEEDRIEKVRLKLVSRQKQQEVLYSDRLDGKISEQLFTRMNAQMELKITGLHNEIDMLSRGIKKSFGLKDCLCGIKEEIDCLGRGYLTNEIAKLAIIKAVVYEPGDPIPFDLSDNIVRKGPYSSNGILSVDFRIDKG